VAGLLAIIAVAAPIASAETPPPFKAATELKAPAEPKGPAPSEAAEEFLG